MLKKSLVFTIVLIMLFSGFAHAGLFDNKKITQALESGKVKIGMTKEALVSEIGYPPEGKDKQSALFYRFAQSKMTAAGKEESWTYQLGATVEGIRSVTIKLVDGKVAEWNEWLDTKK